jgi:Tol biopolymer transport system component
VRVSSRSSATTRSTSSSRTDPTFASSPNGGNAIPGGEGDGYLVYPSFTPDGSRVAYLNGIRTTHQSVVVTRVAGGAPRLFGVDGYLLASPLSFAPGGRSVAVSRFQDRPGEIALFVSSTRSRKERQLIGEPLPRRLTKDTRPDWSPNGRSIAFARLQGSTATLMVVPASGGPAHRLGRGWEPDWAPSGQEIAFVRRDGVYACRPDGTGVRRIVSAVGAATPDFAPDGTRLAYAAAGSVWVVSTSGGVPVKIADGVSGDLDWG